MRLSLTTVILLAVVLWIIGLAAFLAMLWSVADELPPVEQLESYDPRLTTRIISADSVVLKEFYTEQRVLVSLDSIPDNLKNAVLSIEDRRFYQHWGIDIIRLFKAAAVDIATMSTKQGASTITQQLARNLYFTQRQTISRKLKEFITAIQIERRYSKKEILEMYLTQTYFGGGAYGVQAASRRYFSKDVQNLNLQEGALLAAVLKAPSRYSPISSPDKALQRRNLVLYNMYKWGKIDYRTYKKAASKPIELRLSESESPLGIAPYFTEYIRRLLEIKENQYGFNYYADGLTVYTTLDSRTQAAAEAAAAAHIPKLDAVFKRSFLSRQIKPYLASKFPELSGAEIGALATDSEFADSLMNADFKVQAALAAVEPGSGRILALVGGRDFGDSKWNRAVQMARQPGSSFKPFVYLTAIDNGYPVTYRLLNQDVVVEDGSGKRWTPQNDDLSRGGMTTLREGLRRSLNLVTVRLAQEVVPPKMVVEYARKMGFSTPLDAVDAIALGSSSVIPLEAASAYAVFAAEGVYAKPYGIVRIEDKNGKVIEENFPQTRMAISEQTAYIMISMLQTAIDRGTGGSARWKYGFMRKAGGKTGTTNDYTDAWFDGFTPQISCAVWVGLDDPFMSLGRGQSGSMAALPIWADFMKTAHDTLGLPEADFPKPDGIVYIDICTDTYQPATKYCPNTVREVFIQKYAPTDYCTIHRGRRE